MKYLELLIRELREFKEAAVLQLTEGVPTFEEYNRLVGLIRGYERAISETRDMMTRASREDTD